MKSYRTALRAKGVRPIPRFDKLRTSKQAGDLELCAGGIVHQHRRRVVSQGEES